MSGSLCDFWCISLYCRYPVVWEDGWLMEKDCWEEGCECCGGCCELPGIGDGCILIDAPDVAQTGLLGDSCRMGC